ncbi:hypothetical protein K490DRAFT_22210, partial [Saccharata proteae CBS 121410]
RSLLPFCILATLYLYLYPFFHRCEFPAPKYDGQHNISSSQVAPFRLLALGDPQIEGDTSLPDPNDPIFPSLVSFRENVGNDGLALAARVSAYGLLTEDVPRLLEAMRKRIDLFGNDFYLAHIYRTLHWWTRPSHVTVLGDLLGSQWIDDGEFAKRGWRFWNRVFKGGERVGPESIKTEEEPEILGQNSEWARRFINVAGNHDIGYAGDIDEDRITRFERLFGPVNWEVSFRHPNTTLSTDTGTHPSLRIIILNSMNLDTPALTESLQEDTYTFVNNAITSSAPVEDRTTFTLLLTHIPLHKEAGICVDAPFFDYFPDDQGGGIMEQNHIAYDTGKGLLEGIFGLSGNPDAAARGLGRNGLILTGHDHEGCDVYHYHPRDGEKWEASRWADAANLTADRDLPGVREITLRSMMGQYGGYAGLVSVWFDEGRGEWRSEAQMCRLGIQHVWWAVHIFDLITV